MLFRASLACLSQLGGNRTPLYNRVASDRVAFEGHEQGGAWIEESHGKWPLIDAGAFVHPRAVVIGNVTIGRDSSVWPGAVLRGDDREAEIRVGIGSSIQDGAVVHFTAGMSDSIIGDYCTVGHRAIVHGARIGNYCVVGMGAIVLDNADIGDYCIIGAGALITAGKKIPAGSLVMGSPAKVVREITQKERDYISLGWRSYVDNCRRMLGTLE